MFVVAPVVVVKCEYKNILTELQNTEVCFPFSFNSHV